MRDAVQQRLKEGACVFAVAAMVLLILMPVLARGHQPHGRLGPIANGSPDYQYLYKEGLDETGAPFSVNCCLHEGPNGQRGDCAEYPASKVKIVPGGYQLEDGEFIAASDASVSPRDPDGEYRFWRCQHPPERSHCFFAPPSGF